MNSTIRNELKSLLTATEDQKNTLKAVEPPETNTDEISLRKAVKAVLSNYYDDGNCVVSGYERIARALFLIASNPRNKNAINAFRAIVYLSGEANAPLDLGEDPFNKLDLLLAGLRDTAFKTQNTAAKGVESGGNSTDGMADGQ